MLLGWRPIVAENGLDLLEFDGGLEIRARKAHKGDAVRGFLDEISPSAPVAYLGDDMTDEQAFQAMGVRGITVLVRPEWRETRRAGLATATGGSHRVPSVLAEQLQRRPKR